MGFAPLRRVAKLGWWTITFQLPRRLREKRAVRALAESGVFDADFYVTSNPDLFAAGLDPITHYLRHGAAEGRDPSPLFSTCFYLERYPDVVAARINPLLHYVVCGAAEGRDPNPWFDGASYLANNPFVRETGLNPLVHYLRVGAAGRDRALAPAESGSAGRQGSLPT